MDIEITDLKFHKFAIILDNVFTKEECDNLIKLSEEMPENYEIAKISYDDEQIIDKNYRNNQRWLNFDKKLAETEFPSNPIFLLNLKETLFLV